MKIINLVSGALVISALSFGCKGKDKKEGAAATGTAAAPAGETAAPAVKEAPPAKLVPVDLSAAGDDFQKLTVQAPEGATVKKAYDVEVTKGDGFGLQISAGAGNLADLKKEITGNDVNKLKRFVTETATEQVYESEVMGKTQFHFNANVKVGDKEYRCEDIKGGADKTQAQIEAMLASCKTLAAAP